MLPRSPTPRESERMDADRQPVSRPVVPAQQTQARAGRRARTGDEMAGSQVGQKNGEQASPVVPGWWLIFPRRKKEGRHGSTSGEVEVEARRRTEESGRRGRR